MEKNILVFGASSTFGACDTEKRGWAGRLGNFVEKKTDWYTLVYNLGVSGETSDDVLERFGSECTKSRKPAIIIISIGGNDSQYINSPGNMKVPPEKFRENLIELIGLARKKVDKILFLTPTPVDESKTMPIPWKTDTYYTNENIRKYSQIAREVCEERGVPFIDITGLFGKATDEFFHDGLHPNSKGHQRIFEVVKQFLEEKGWI